MCNRAAMRDIYSIRTERRLLLRQPTGVSSLLFSRAIYIYMATWVLGILVFASAALGGDKGCVDAADSGSCGFPAIYSFGDDNSDTGEYAVAFGEEVGLPNGQTFFGKSSGRYCDGRLIIDFITEHLGFPYLSVYVDAYGSNFSHGANFAMKGQFLLDRGQSPFDLQHQIFQFTQFKSRTTDLFNQRNDVAFKRRIPRPEDFSKALYIIDIGQNDFTFYLNQTTTSPQKIIPKILNKFSRSLTILHEWEGARFFWIHNVGPVGCLPYSVKYCQKQNPSGCGLDPNGCVKDLNGMVQEFNTLLKDRVSKARTLFPNATFTYVDVYSAKYNLISQAKSLGFEDPMKFCCGSFDGSYVWCGQKGPNGGVIGSACKDPSKYISWDGLHYSEAANQYVAKLILNGSLSDPPSPLSKACRL